MKTLIAFLGATLAVAGAVLLLGGATAAGALAVAGAGACAAIIATVTWRLDETEPRSVSGAPTQPIEIRRVIP